MFRGVPASPIISFRPLNNIVERANTLNNTPTGTPTHSKNNSMTPRNQFQSDESFQTEEKIRSLQNAKKELDILEGIKSLIDESYNLTVHSKSFTAQRNIFTKFLNQLNNSLHFNTLSEKGKGLVQRLRETLEKKIKDLDQLQAIEKNYDKTLPNTAAKIKKEEEKMISNKLKRYVTNSINSREDLSKRTFDSPHQRFFEGVSQSPIDSKNYLQHIERKNPSSELSSFVAGGRGNKNFEMSKSPSISDNASLSQYEFLSSNS